MSGPEPAWLEVLELARTTEPTGHRMHVIGFRCRAPETGYLGPCDTLLVEADELWVEAYQGEILGEVIFSLMAERADDPDRRRDLKGAGDNDALTGGASGGERPLGTLPQRVGDVRIKPRLDEEDMRGLAHNVSPPS